MLRAAWSLHETPQHARLATQISDRIVPSVLLLSAQHCALPLAAPRKPPLLGHAPMSQAAALSLQVCCRKRAQSSGSRQPCGLRRSCLPPPAANLLAPLPPAAPCADGGGAGAAVPADVGPGQPGGGQLCCQRPERRDRCGAAVRGCSAFAGTRLQPTATQQLPHLPRLECLLAHPLPHATCLPVLP